MRLRHGMALICLALTLSGCAYFDNKAFQQAQQQHTEAAYQHYMKEYPQGRHMAKAERCVDKLAYDHACKVNTYQAYEAYLEDHSDGGYADQAEQLAKVRREEKYRSCAGKAKEYTRSYRWDLAIAAWKQATAVIDKEEARDAIGQCEYNRDNPVQLVDYTVRGNFRYDLRDPDTIPYTHRLRVRGELHNLSPRPVTSITLSLKLYWVAIADAKAETTYFTVLTNRTITPGQTARFDASVKVGYAHELMGQKVDVVSHESR